MRYSCLTFCNPVPSRFSLSVAAVFLCLFGLCSAGAAAEPMIFFNEDNDHFFNLPPECMTQEYVTRYFDQYANTKITHYLMCPNGQVTSYNSSVHQTVWDEIDQYPNPPRWMANAKLLFDRGVDFYSTGVERCRANGISPWLTVRMNDVHCVGVKPRHFRTTRHHEEHPELWRIPNALEEKISDWNAYAYNYSKKETRDYFLALINELLERYDVDGIELDWMRFGYHLTPGKEREESVYLTEFVREARKLTTQWSQKRNHAIKLAARIPETPETAIGLGMDGVSWAKEGLVDVLVLSTFLSADFNTPMEQWTAALGESASNVLLIPATDNGIYAYSQRRVYTDAALVYGWANDMYLLGAENFYLFNYAYTAGDDPGLGAREILATGLGRDTVLNAQRRHPVSLRDFVYAGVSSDCQLPKKTDQDILFKVQAGMKPTRGRVHVCLALSEAEKVRETPIHLKLNGHTTPMALDMLWSQPKCFGDNVARSISFEFTLDDLVEGTNEIEIEATEYPQEIVWAEIRCGF